MLDVLFVLSMTYFGGVDLGLAALIIVILRRSKWMIIKHILGL